MKNTVRMSALSALLVAAAYFLQQHVENTSLDNALATVIEQQDLQSDPSVGLSLAKITSPEAQLGKQLFFTKSLSGNDDVACASCHHPLLMGGDDLSLPIGIGATEPDLLGPGRKYDLSNKTHDIRADGSPNVPRHSPTTFNTGLYKKTLFWDGRVSQREDGGITSPDSLVFGEVSPYARPSLLATQAQFPVVSREEMRGHKFLTGEKNENVRAALAEKLVRSGEEGFSWAAVFESVYGKGEGAPVSYARIAAALAKYQESQLFIDNEWFRYIQGEKEAISAKAKEGALLFYRPYSEGGLNCVACHSGKLLSDEDFHPVGFPQIGRGKGANGADFGRFHASKRERDRYLFRTPSLLNVAHTSPYGHTGSFSDLRQLLKYHLDPLEGFSSFDFSLNHLPQFQGSGYFYPNSKALTQQAIDDLYKRDAQGQLTSVAKVEVNEEQLDSLVAFLDTLSDRCLQAVSQGKHTCLNPWLPFDEQHEPKVLAATFGDFEVLVNDWLSPEAVSSAINELEINGQGDIEVENCLTENNATQPAGKRFVDVALEAGLDYFVPEVEQEVIESTPSTDVGFEALMFQEFMGAAIAADFNSDLFPDLIVFNGADKPPKVLINKGGKSFVDQTKEYGLDTWKNKAFMGGGALDLDGDGDVDLVLTGRKMDADNQPTGEGVLDIYEFDKGSWTLIKQKETITRPALSVSFADANGDQLVDIFVASWSKVAKTQEQFLWLNNGDMQFSGVGVSSGISTALPTNDFSFSPLNVDLDGDLWPDLVMVSDFGNTQSLFNLGKGRYSSDMNIVPANTFTDENGMGVAAADFDNDADLDVFITSVYAPEGLESSFPGTGNRYYVNDGQGALEERSEQFGVRDGGWGWGACAADFNADGWQDIFHTNGFGQVVSRHSIYPATPFEPFFADTSKLFVSAAGASFKEQAGEYGVAGTGQGRGVVCFDYDRDGDIDIFVINLIGRPHLYQNQVNNRARGLTLSLADHKSRNRQAVGAKITLSKAGGKGGLQYREVQANTNYISQSPLSQFFGFGEGLADDSYDLKIIWPRPLVEETHLSGLKPGQCLQVTRNPG